jgi:arylsulfatase A-like enzyme
MSVDGTTLVILLLLVAALVGLLFVLERRSTEEHSKSPAPATVRVADLFTIAIWFGLATSVLQLTLAFVDRYLRDRLLMVSPHVVWLVPVSIVLIRIGIAALLAVVTLVNPQLVPRRLSFALFAGLGIFGRLLPFHQLHIAAAMVLTAGVAAQIGRQMGRRPEYWVRTMRKTNPLMIATIVVMALGGAGWRWAAEAIAQRRLPTASAGAPNVLLLVLDTVRAANLSHYGYDRPTSPELARWAADGTTFDWAFSTAPWTLTSHASLFTGLYPNQTGGDFEHPVATKAPMVAEVLRDRGYVTGGFVANLKYTSYESGLARGFAHFDDYRLSRRQVLMHSWIAQTPLYQGIVDSRSLGQILATVRSPSLNVEPGMFNDHTYPRKSAAEISAAFLDWQSAHRERPFFAFLNYFDAHVPYRSPPSVEDRFVRSDKPKMGRYDAAIAFIDQEIGRLLDELQRRGVLDNTIVVVTSDHGEQFGEHGLEAHANSLYLPLLHVPLVIRYPPRVAKGVRIESSVSLRDLAATLMDLVGLSDESRVPGISLVAKRDPDNGVRHGSPLVAEISGNVRPSPDWPVFFGPMRSILDQRFHYIRRGDGLEELYDYRADPAEALNLIAAPERQQDLGRLRGLLASTTGR